MTATPSPLDRLLQLEQDIAQLRSQSAKPAPPPGPPGESPARRPWPVDELLLTRLIRRSPQALMAYQEPAELTTMANRDLQLTVADSDSVFRLCELAVVDAVVWIEGDPSSWVWESESFRQIYSVPKGLDGQQDLVLQALPVFKPVVRSQQWTLFRRGEMIPRHRPFPEKESQNMLLRRLESLERQVSQEMTRQEHELNELRSELRVQQDMLNRLLRITDRSQ